MRISIGMLAWNESKWVTRTIESLLEQSIFTQTCAPFELIEVVCVPNGCTDDTADVADRAFKKFTRTEDSPALNFKVCEVEEPGKANAWNRFVHEFSDPTADCIILIDADIWFDNPDTLRNMVTALNEHPEAHISVDIPIKDIALKENKSVLDRLSLGVSKLNVSGPAQVCGQLYCGRGTFMRRIWLPIGLLCDDGFLAEMARTDLLTKERCTDRIVRASEATHIFEAYSSARSIFGHQQLVLIGSVVVGVLLRHIGECASHEDCGQLIRQRNEEDPDWIATLLRKEFERETWWVLPMHPVNTRRLKALRNLPLKSAIFALPAAVAISMIDTLVAISANQWIKKPRKRHTWKKLRDD